MAGELTPNGYRKRLVERRLDTLLRSFGCVELTGPKWCGKTWTALSRAASVTKLDRLADREAALVDPSLALLGETPHLVDEWQEVPAVWDAARRFVDDSGSKRGLLLLTGSTALRSDQRAKVHHSGAGRIARLKMYPLSLAESGDSTGEVSLERLFREEDFKPARRETSIEEVALWCCRGGWPANLELNDEAALETARQYLQAVLDANVIDEGRSPAIALAALQALALNASRAVTYKTLINDMSHGEGSRAVSEETLVSYLEMFDRFYLTEELPGWEPPLRSKARVRVKPKRYFVDPSLAASLVGATPERLLRDMQTLGDLFENLVLRDLRVYLSTYGMLDDRLSYYRDDKGLEVDAIIEHAGKWGAVEIKLSDTKADEAAANLVRLRDKVLKNAAARNSEPAFLAVVVGRGALAYRRPDGVHVIPIATLAP